MYYLLDWNLLSSEHWLSQVLISIDLFFSSFANEFSSTDMEIYLLTQSSGSKNFTKLLVPCLNLFSKRFYEIEFKLQSVFQDIAVKHSVVETFSVIQVKSKSKYVYFSRYIIYAHNLEHRGQNKINTLVYHISYDVHHVTLAETHCFPIEFKIYDTCRPGPNGRYLADDIFKWIFLN